MFTGLKITGCAQGKDPTQVQRGTGTALMCDKSKTNEEIKFATEEMPVTKLSHDVDEMDNIIGMGNTEGNMEETA